MIVKVRENAKGVRCAGKMYEWMLMRDLATVT
jgi:hypothetical protein